MSAPVPDDGTTASSRRASHAWAGSLVADCRLDRLLNVSNVISPDERYVVWPQGSIYDEAAPISGNRLWHREQAAGVSIVYISVSALQVPARHAYINACTENQHRTRIDLLASRFACDPGPSLHVGEQPGKCRDVDNVSTFRKDVHLRGPRVTASSPIS